MQSDEPLDPITAQLRRVAEQKRKDRDASQGEQLLTADFGEQARKTAPRELKKIEEILRERATSINARPTPGVPVLAFEKPAVAPDGVANSRLDAGQFAIVLDPYQQLRQFTLTVHVGLHPNAAQFMATMPRIPTASRTYRAAADDEGFFWTDVQRGGRIIAEQIVDKAFELLFPLLANDL